MNPRLRLFRRVFSIALGTALLVVGGALAVAAEEAPNSGNVVGPRSRITFGGRAAIGLIGAQDSGGFRGIAYPKPSFAMPDVRLDVNYAISPNVAGRVRINVDNAAIAAADRVYIVVKNLADRDWLNLRVGLGLISFGECCDLNNPIDDWFVTPTAGNVSGSDEGAILFGTLATAATAFGGPVKLGYDIGLYNGERGVIPDMSSAKAVSGRLRAYLGDAFFLSASYYTSHSLSATSTSLSSLDIARTLATPTLGTRPAGTVNWWNRDAWVVNAQWRFALHNPEALAGNRWSRVTDGLGAVAHSGFIRGVYGGFTDDPRNGAARRKGDFWSIQGVYNLTPSLYLGAGFSTINLDGTVEAHLNPVAATDPAANSYDRTTVILGYNLTERTNIKAEYNWNTAKYSVARPDLKDDHWAVLLTTHF